MSFLLLSHIIMFSMSLLMTSTGMIISAAGRSVPHRIMSLNLAITLLGVATGAALLLSKPLGTYCAMLLGYVSVFALTQRFMARRNQRLASSPEA